jgi:hypothetical protein
LSEVLGSTVESIPKAGLQVTLITLVTL